jgi:hypothetical protein
MIKKRRGLFGFRQSSNPKDQVKQQPIAPHPRGFSSGWKEGAGAGWKRSLLTGDWSRRNQPCSISLFFPDSLPFQENTCLAPGQLASDPSQHLGV